MTENQSKQRQATWKVLLIVGIVAGVAWLATNEMANNRLLATINGLAGIFAIVGLGGGVLSLITSRRN